MIDEHTEVLDAPEDQLEALLTGRIIKVERTEEDEETPDLFVLTYDDTRKIVLHVTYLALLLQDVGEC